MMQRTKLFAWLILAALLAPLAHAADSTVPSLPSASTVTGTDITYCSQAAGTNDRQCTVNQLAAFFWNSPTLTSPNLGTPSFAQLDNAVGLPISTGLSGAGTGVLTALGVGVNSSGGMALVNGPQTVGNCLKWSASGIEDAGAACGSGGGSGTVNSGAGGQVAWYATTGSAVSGNANANLSSGDLALGQAGSVVGSVSLLNATSGSVKIQPATGALGSAVITAPATTGTMTVLGNTTTGSGSIVLASSPTLVTPNLGTPSAINLANGVSLPISTGVSGLGTGVATALGVNVGSSGAFVTNGGALGTPSSGTATNLTGLPLSTGVTGNLALTNLATISNNTILGNNSGGAASPSALTGAQTTALLSNCVGDSGSGGTKGLVPAPGAGDAAAGKFLAADCTFKSVIGGAFGDILWNNSGSIDGYAQVPVAKGGTGTSSPALTAGAGITITGSWPNNTIKSSKIILSADMTFYVDPGGNDANDCSLANPCLTPQHVADLMARIDGENFAVVIQINDGTYSAGGGVDVMAIMNRPHNVKFFGVYGNGTTPGNVIFDCVDQSANGLTLGFRSDLFALNAGVIVDEIYGIHFKNCARSYFGANFSNSVWMHDVESEDPIVDFWTEGWAGLFLENPLLVGARSTIAVTAIFGQSYIGFLSGAVGATFGSEAFRLTDTAISFVDQADYTNITAGGGAAQWIVDAFCKLDTGGVTVPGAAGTTDALGKVL